jgi:hypothetical protein
VKPMTADQSHIQAAQVLDRSVALNGRAGANHSRAPKTAAMAKNITKSESRAGAGCGLVERRQGKPQHRCGHREG